MRLYASWMVLGLGVAATMMLPLAGSSCGRSACLAVSQTDLQKNGGACPSMADAFPRFTAPGCGSPVTSVDGPGELDGTLLCCYPVTQVDNDFGCEPGFDVGGGGLCAADGDFCVGDGDCCSLFCRGEGFCGSGFDCLVDGEPCSADSDCCSGLCGVDGACGFPQCGATGDACSGDADCCSGVCDTLNQCG
jgi:hypothetical protein